MGATYTLYSDTIDCNVGDKVYVYKKEIFNGEGEINKDMVGTVENINQAMQEDAIALEYLTYNVTIRMSNGKVIRIKDEVDRPILRKYEFITLRDLEKDYKYNLNELPQ